MKITRASFWIGMACAVSGVFASPQKQKWPTDSVSITVRDSLSADTLKTLMEVEGDRVLTDSLLADSMQVDTVTLQELGDIFLLNTVMGDSIVVDEPEKKDTLPSAVDTLGVTEGKRAKVQAAKRYIPHPCVRRFARFVRGFHQDYEVLLDRWDDIYLPAAPADIQSDADFYKLIIPTTYYAAPIEQAFSISDWKPVIPFDRPFALDSLIPALPRLTKSADIDRQINRQLLSFYLDYPDMVRKNELDLKGLEPLGEEYKVRKPKKEKVFYLATHSTHLNQLAGEELLVMKPNFWTMSGNGYVQFSQNFISENWYKGGESTKSLLSGLVWQVNYDDHQKIQFENRVEWKLGFIATPSDTVHQYKPNNDLFRVSSKLGYKAIWSWYYTLSAEFKTQFASSYETNSEKLVSAFLSPAELNVGLGMDYKYVKDGVCNLSVLINPFNYTRYSVKSNRVDPTKFNIEAGKKVEKQLGSRVEGTLSWAIIKNLLWESRFSYITNYEKVISEWENTFTFAFNRFFSTKLFVHARFDDSVNRDPDHSYFQLQELLSLGFNYVW